MFTQDQLFKSVAPRSPVVVFVDFFLLLDAVPPAGADVNAVSEDGGEITLTTYL
jgi:hypothetical protein